MRDTLNADTLTRAAVVAPDAVDRIVASWVARLGADTPLRLGGRCLHGFRPVDTRHASGAVSGGLAQGRDVTAADCVADACTAGKGAGRRVTATVVEVLQALVARGIDAARRWVQDPPRRGQRTRRPAPVAVEHVRAAPPIWRALDISWVEQVRAWVLSRVRPRLRRVRRRHVGNGAIRGLRRAGAIAPRGQAGRAQEEHPGIHGSTRRPKIARLYSLPRQVSHRMPSIPIRTGCAHVG